VWVCRTFLSSARLLAGELEAARQAAEESRAFAEAIGTPWLYLDDVLMGVVEHHLGRPEASIARLRAAQAAEPPTFWSGISRSYLFYVLAFEGNTAATELLDATPFGLPARGQAATLGTWMSLAPRVRGLMHLGRLDRAAALHPALEALVESGLVMHFSLTRTNAGIAASAASDWAVAEQHFQTAFNQAEMLGLPVAAADAREWYARMLLARLGPDDRMRASKLLTEAVARYDVLGMTAFARRARSLAG
jgi:hypothetical protein